MQTDDKAIRLLEAIKGIDLTSADGRAGIGCILAEIERVSPGAILQRAASIELRRLGCLSSSDAIPRSTDRLKRSSRP